MAVLSRAELRLLGLMVHRSLKPGAFDPGEAIILAREIGVPADRADVVRAAYDFRALMDQNRQALRDDMLALLACPS